MIFIIILNWNQIQLTVNCVESLLKVHNDQYRIVVIDNASTDKSPYILRKKYGGRIDIIENRENLGFAGGNNIGIQYAFEQGAHYVMLLNNDTVVDQYFLAPLVKILRSNSRIGAVTPKIYYLHKPTTIWAAGGEIKWWLGKAQSRGKDQLDVGQFYRQESVDYATGCCILMSRLALQKVGLLDEQYFAYFEDADWCVRAQQAGFEIVYAPTSKIWHVAGASTRSEVTDNAGRTNPIAYYLNARNNLWFINRYTKGVMRLTALATFFFRTMVVYTIAFSGLRRWEKLKNLWRGALDGWKLKDTLSKT